MTIWAYRDHCSLEVWRDDLAHLHERDAAGYGPRPSRSPLMSLFEVRPVRLGASAELGCFATSPIPAGALICRFTGPVFTFAEMLERVRTGVERSGDDPLQVDDDLFMDVDAPGVCFNHSCGPNAAMRGTADLIALRGIGTDEEIVFDYSLTIPASNPWVMAFTCGCGSPLCRGTLGNRLTVPDERVQALAAAGALQDFILREMRGA